MSLRTPEEINKRALSYSESFMDSGIAYTSFLNGYEQARKDCDHKQKETWREIYSRAKGDIPDESGIAKIFVWLERNYNSPLEKEDEQIFNSQQGK